MFFLPVYIQGQKLSHATSTIQITEIQEQKSKSDITPFSWIIQRPRLTWKTGFFFLLILVAVSWSLRLTIV